jgi:hypothetical protein
MSVNISSRVFVDSSDNQNVDNPLLKSIQVNGNKQPTINDEYLIKLDVGSKIFIDVDGRFNSKLSVFDANGNKVATNSSSSRAEVDETVNPYKYDPYVVFDVEHHGMYLIVLENGSGEYTLNLSKDTSISVLEDSSDNLINVLGNGIDDANNTLSIASIGNAKHGSVTIINNQIAYTPEANFYGKDEFSFIYANYLLEQSEVNYQLQVVNVVDISFEDFKLDVNNNPINDSVFPTIKIAATKLIGSNDYYSFSLLQGENIFIDVDGRFNSKLTLSNAKDEVVKSNGSSSRQESDEIEGIYKYDPYIEYSALESGEYTIKLENGSGNYQLYVSKDSRNAVVEVVKENTPINSVSSNLLEFSHSTLTASYASIALNGEDYTNHSIDAVSRIRVGLNFDSIKTLIDSAELVTSIKFDVILSSKVADVALFATQDNSQWLMEVDFLGDFNASISNNITGSVNIQHLPGLVSLSNSSIDLLDIYLNPNTGVNDYEVIFSNMIIGTSHGDIEPPDQAYLVGVDLSTISNNDRYLVNEDSLSGVDISNLIDNDLQFLNNNYGFKDVSFVTDFTLGSVDQNGLYVPSKNAAGTDTATYQIVDAKGGKSNISTITIAINPINDKPIANDNVFSNMLLEDGKGIDVSNIVNNDVDVEDGLLLYENVAYISKFENGSVDAKGFYKPNANYYGTDKASYTVADSNGLVSEVANISIEIKSVNDDIQGDVVVSGTVEIGKELSMSHNLSDVDGLEVLHYQWLRGDSHIAGATAEKYTISRDDIDYQLAVKVTGIDKSGTTESVSSVSTSVVLDNNSAPIAIDDTFVLIEDNSIALDLLSNDDSDDAVSIDSYTSPKNGSIKETIFGDLIYTPNLNFVGDDSFTYLIKDIHGAQSKEASVALIVNADNIVFKPLKVGDATTISASEALILLGKDALEGLSGNDRVIKFDFILDATKIEQFNINAQSILGVQFGIDNASNKVGWLLGSQINHDFELSVINTFDANFALGDTSPVVDNNALNNTGRWQINATQSIATVFIKADANSDSVNIKIKDIMLDVVTNSGVIISIAPNSYDVSFAVESIVLIKKELVLADVTIKADLADDSFVVNEDEASLLDVLVNDRALKINIDTFTNPSHGGLEINPEGIFIYTPEGDYFGADSFTYQTSQSSKIVVVDILVQSANDTPTALNIEAQSVDENAQFSIDLSSFFSDNDSADTTSYQVMLNNNTSLPSWLTLDANTQILSGVPKNQDVDDLEIKVNATDSQNATIESVFKLTVNEKADAVVCSYDGTLLDSLTMQFYSNGNNSNTNIDINKGDVNIKENVVFDAIKIEQNQYTENAINISDAIDVLRHIVGLDVLKSSSFGYYAADVNNDGNVNISDAISILRHVVGLDEIDEFDLIDSQGNRVTSLATETSLVLPEYQLIANGDVDFSGEFITATDLI